MFRGTFPGVNSGTTPPHGYTAYVPPTYRIRYREKLLKNYIEKGLVRMRYVGATLTMRRIPGLYLEELGRYIS